MNGTELLRIVENIARDKAIDRELIFTDIEQAVASGLRKQFNTEDVSEFQVSLDRTSGAIAAKRLGAPVPLDTMGRIGAQTVKQVMIQLIRQDERGSIYEEFTDRVGTIVTGTVARFQGSTMIVNLGRVEGIMPRSEQIFGEHHEPGERIQALVTEVRDTPGGVKIILSRSHPEMIRRLFEREVPEVGERTIEIKALAREAGHRTKLAVSSIDAKVDAVGACVGVRGSRIKNIVDELGGEKIDIVRWNESSQILITNALKPAEVTEVSLCFELGRATVVVNEDQLSLAIGKRGQNVRLAARLTGWDIDILTPQEFQNNVERLDRTLKSVPGVQQEMIDKIIALGLIDVRDIEEVDIGPLMEEVGMEEEVAEECVNYCIEEAKIVAKETEAKKKAEEAAKSSAGSIFGEPAPASSAGGTGSATAGRQEGELSAGSAAEDAPYGSASSTEDDEVDDPAEEDEEQESSRVPGPLEATNGGSPETQTHSEHMVAGDSEDLSPEEQALHIETDDSPNHVKEREIDSEDTQEAALAEGREAPPQDEPNR